jgi:DNA-binding NtrC family response regulator
VVLQALLKKEGYDVATASDGMETLRVIKEGGVEVVVTDLKMPRLDGLDLLDRVTRDYPSTPVIIVTAHGTVATAVDALKKGAFDYITKPFERDELKNIIHKAVMIRRLNEEELIVSPGDIDRQGIIGGSEPMKKIYETIKKVAPTTTTVLISGETGTGKDLVAYAIHRNSPRRDNPFVKINCAAIAETLIESELFGYEKGAFTGAVSTKPGRFELADKGRKVQRGPLYYRLNVFPTRLPPLRERRDDILSLAAYFIEKFNAKLDRAVKNIDHAVQDVLVNYDWPGNIRELENLMERMVLMSSGETITMQDIPPELVSAAEVISVSQPAGRKKPSKELLKSHMEEVEKQTIIECPEEVGGNVTKAAERLGLSRSGLYLKMIKYNIRK